MLRVTTTLKQPATTLKPYQKDNKQILKKPTLKL